MAMDSLGKLFSISFESFILIMASSIGIYAAIVFYTRVFGKRSFSKLSSFDFAMTVAIGSLIATTVLSKTVSMLEGILGAAALYFLQLTLAYFRRFDFIKNLIDNKPTLLMFGTEFLLENMKDVRVTEGDIRSKLREANVKNLKEVKAVVFETTGDIAVIHGDDNATLDEWILKDVIR